MANLKNNLFHSIHHFTTVNNGSTFAYVIVECSKRPHSFRATAADSSEMELFHQHIFYELMDIIQTPDSMLLFEHSLYSP